MTLISTVAPQTSQHSTNVPKVRGKSINIQHQQLQTSQSTFSPVLSGHRWADCGARTGRALFGWRCEVMRTLGGDTPLFPLLPTFVYFKFQTCVKIYVAESRLAIRLTCHHPLVCTCTHLEVGTEPRSGAPSKSARGRVTSLDTIIHHYQPLLLLSPYYALLTTTYYILLLATTT